MTCLIKILVPKILVINSNNILTQNISSNKIDEKFI